jgi:trans-aconitate methyltransferase
VDLAAPLLERLRVRADHLPQLTTHHRDVTMWKESSYDLVQCVLGIFFLPDMDAGVEALIGRLRPGGRVGLTIWRRPAMAAPGSALMRATSEVTGTPLAFDPGQHPEERINDAGSFTAWLGERGLRDVSVLEHELHLPWSRDLAWLLVTGSGFVGMLQGLDTEQVDDVRNRYLAILEVEGTETFDATTLIGIGTRP